MDVSAYARMGIPCQPSPPPILRYNWHMVSCGYDIVTVSPSKGGGGGLETDHPTQVVRE